MRYSTAVDLHAARAWNMESGSTLHRRADAQQRCVTNSNRRITPRTHIVSLRNAAATPRDAVHSTMREQQQQQLTYRHTRYAALHSMRHLRAHMYATELCSTVCTQVAQWCCSASNTCCSDGWWAPHVQPQRVEEPHQQLRGPITAGAAAAAAT